MSEHLGKIALLVLMTQGFRAIGRKLDPRWAGLALGLPCSTAVALVGGGSDRGVDYAVVMSGTSLIGLAGAVALPMAYARALREGWRLPWALLVGVATYLVVALAAGRLLPGRGHASVGLALMAVLVAMFVASRIPVDGKMEGPGRPSGSRLSRRLLRVIIPIGCLLGSLLLGEAFGPEVAGLMSTFPGLTLTVLWLTHLESGPISAIRIARALPAGNLGMLAFLAAFRFGCPAFGLGWGTLTGYLAALIMLAVVLSFDRMIGWVRDSISTRRPFPSVPRPIWPRECRRFSPLMERLAV